MPAYRRTNQQISSSKPLSIVVAMDAMGGFGINGKLPWDLPGDRKHFKELTMNKIVVMGHKTYEEIAEYYSKSKKFLPGRESYVISRGTPKLMDGVTLCSSLRDFLNKTMDTHQNKETFVIGGEKLFIEALSWTTYVYVTMIIGDYSCDKYFPINTLQDKFIQESITYPDENGYAFIKFTRSKP